MNWRRLLLAALIVFPLDVVAGSWLATNVPGVLGGVFAFIIGLGLGMLAAIYARE